jgi:hypothetical protein
MFTESQRSVDDILTACLINPQSQPAAALEPAIHLALVGTTEQVAEKLHRIAALGWRSASALRQVLCIVRGFSGTVTF